MEWTDNGVLSWQKVEEVCTMLLDPPFQSCHEFVSPLSYMASCSNDLCMYEHWLQICILMNLMVPMVFPFATLLKLGCQC